MVILTKDGSVYKECQHSAPDAQYSCYAEVSAESLAEQSNLIERIVSFAFDRVGVRRLEVRVLDVRAVCVGSACGDV